MTNHHGNNDAWPHAQVETLKALWIEGKSGGEIAKAMPGRTRCSVIAKAHRLGLPKRGIPVNLAGRAPAAPEVKRDRSTGAIVQDLAARTPPKPGQQNRPAVAFGKVQVVNAAETEKRRAAQQAQGAKIVEAFAAPANDTAIPLMERSRYQCAWPVGEPERPSQLLCCGLPVQEGVGAALESYCGVHQKRAASAYQPARREVRAPVEYRRPVRQPEPSLWDGARVA